MLTWHWFICNIDAEQQQYFVVKRGKHIVVWCYQAIITLATHLAFTFTDECLDSTWPEQSLWQSSINPGPVTTLSHFPCHKSNSYCYNSCVMKKFIRKHSVGWEYLCIYLIIYLFVVCMNVCCTVWVSLDISLTSDGRSDGHKGPESASTLDHHFANILD